MGDYQQGEKVYRRIELMMPDDVVAHAKAISMAALTEEMTAVRASARRRGLPRVLQSVALTTPIWYEAHV